MSVCLSHSFKLFLLVCFSMESSHFLAVSSPCALCKTVFFDVWFRPPKAQNLLPQILGTKSPISQLVWQIDRRCLGLPVCFQGWPIQWNHAKCCGADPCYHGNEIWARRRDSVAYRLVIIVFSRCKGFVLKKDQKKENAEEEISLEDLIEREVTYLLTYSCTEFLYLSVFLT